MDFSLVNQQVTSAPKDAASSELRAKTHLKITLNAIAYLRAISDGLDRRASALRYLELQGAKDIQQAEEDLIRAVRVIARRLDDPAWRLLGVSSNRLLQETKVPSLEDFVYERGLEDWGEDEQLAHYQEEYGSGGHKQGRRAANLKRVHLLLARIQRIGSVEVQERDRLSDWFNPVLVGHLERARVYLVLDLQKLVSVRNSWWDTIPGIGKTKGQRIESHLEMLTGELARKARSSGDLSDLLRSETALPSPIVERIESSAAAWLDSKSALGQKTKDGYARAISKFCTWLKSSGISVIDQQAMEQFQSFCVTASAAPQRGKAAGSLSSAVQNVAVVQGFLKSASGLDYCVQADSLRPIKRPTPITDVVAKGDQLAAAVVEDPKIDATNETGARALFLLEISRTRTVRARQLLQARIGDVQKSGRTESLHFPDGTQVALIGDLGRRFRSYLRCKGVSAQDKDKPLISAIGDSAKPISYHSLYETMVRHASNQRTVRLSMFQTKRPKAKHQIA